MLSSSNDRQWPGARKPEGDTSEKSLEPESTGALNEEWFDEQSRREMRMNKP
jgi:hypothetical protein